VAVEVGHDEGRVGVAPDLEDDPDVVRRLVPDVDEGGERRPMITSAIRATRFAFSCPYGST